MDLKPSLEIFESYGLDKKRAEETLKNEKLSKVLFEILREVCNSFHHLH
jgi:hypothetical protein